MVPGNFPCFLFATHPHSKPEAIDLLKITQNTLREIWNESNPKRFETAKEFSAVNWLDEQGNPNEKLSKFLNHFPTKPHAKDNLNNFAVTYPIFRGFQGLTIKQLQNNDCSLLSLPDYDKNQTLNSACSTSTQRNLKPNVSLKTKSATRDMNFSPKAIR